MIGLSAHSGKKYRICQHLICKRGRDATDVAIVTSFGPCTLAGFKVIADEVKSVAPANT